MKKTGFVASCLVVMAFAGASLPVEGQAGSVGESARGAFLESRRQASQRPRRGRASSGEAKPPVAEQSSSKPEPVVKPVALLTSLALGYSIYRKSPTGETVRVSPKHVFKAGDEIRLVVEPNSDGYLYVFYQDADGQAEMVFPHPLVNQGENRVEAHVQAQVPGNGWFEFDDRPATRRLLVVLAREPLAGVIDRLSLIAFCRPNPEECTWRPSHDVWDNVLARLDLPASLARSQDGLGLAQLAEEREALSRGLRVKPQGAAPSVIKMNSSAQDGVLVAAADLIQR